MAASNNKTQDLTGQVFGRWAVLSYSHVTGEGRHRVHYWHCRCACGMERTVNRASLVKGTSVSCGCYHKEVVGKNSTRHGMARTPEYHAWQHMKYRCENPKDAEYKNYGERGITVCDRWQSFPNFLTDMGIRPTATHSLERIDNEQGYSPDNCRWATDAEQSNNRRACWYVTHNGQTKTVAQWARHYGLPPRRFRERLRLGWSFERAIST